MTSPILGIPELAEAAAGNHIKVNEAIRRLEQGAVLQITSRTLTAPPGSPTEGVAYIPAATATGAWAGQEGKVAYYVNGAWQFITTQSGMQAFFLVEKMLHAYSAVESLWFPTQPLWSTTEHWTGRYGSGGTKLYAKSFSFAMGDGTGNTTHAHGITNLDRANHIEFDGSINNASLVYKAPQQFGTVTLEMRAAASNIILAHIGVDLSAYTCKLRLEYERTP